uniref:Fibrinogen C-terminal domain-containing protein n=1 Tax=Macrostomum lignano TaxID=282301 RepID=A0A1I8IXI4_9PLAT
MIFFVKVQKFRCDKWRKILFAVFVILLVYAAITQIATLSTKTSRHPVFLATLFNAFNRNGGNATLIQSDLTSKLPNRKVQLKPKTWLPAVCANESCRLDYETSLHKRGIFPIPKIRHILWRNEFVSKYFVEHIKTWQKLHPDWIHVLWRDKDMDPFVAENFPKLLKQFKSQKMHIMKVDMFRYMLMYKLGGTYADLDYSLTRNLDEFRRFYAVVTREPETHSLQLFGPHWPIRPVASPAFLMSAPGHKFYRFVLDQLSLIRPNWDILGFAGPVGLTRILERYNAKHPLTNDSMEAVYVPPSFSFYPYENNSLSGVSTNFRNYRLSKMSISCRKLNDTKDSSMKLLRKVKNLTQLCSNITNYNPVTDSSPTVYAVHDMRKSETSWGGTAMKTHRAQPSGQFNYWKTFQHRVSSNLSFDKNWTDYSTGFGLEEADNFWLGLEQIHQLTKHGGRRNLNFTVSGPKDKYRAVIGEFDSAASSIGQAMTTSDIGIQGNQFSTPDSDNDLSPDNCALERHGGWWFGYCTFFNPNGIYFDHPTALSVHYAQMPMMYHCVGCPSSLGQSYSLRTGIEHRTSVEFGSASGSSDEETWCRRRADPQQRTSWCSGSCCSRGCRQAQSRDRPAWRRGLQLARLRLGEDQRQVDAADVGDPADGGTQLASPAVQEEARLVQ